MVRCCSLRLSGSTARGPVASRRSPFSFVTPALKRNDWLKRNISPSGRVAFLHNRRDGREETPVEPFHVPHNGSDSTRSAPQAFKKRALPISPLMNSTAIAAKEKYSLPKSRPFGPPSPGLRAQLAKNPYALALSTPIRSCQITKVTLPKFFLQDFGLMAHPDTAEPWWVPTSLSNEYAEKNKVELENASQDGGPMDTGKRGDWLFEQQDLERNDRTEPLSNVHSPHESTSAGPVSPSPTVAKQLPRVGRNIYTLSRKYALEALQRKDAGYGDGYSQNFGIYRMGTSFAGKSPGWSSWRKDMDSFVLKLMRRRLVERLTELVNRGHGYIAGWEDSQNATVHRRQAGALLWTGNPSPTGQEFNGDEKVVQLHEIPPEFATVVAGNSELRKVPVHNLCVLLGTEHLRELRRKCPIFESKICKVRHKRATVDVQMRLWKLQGFLAEFKEVCKIDRT
jgi:hypothetical protein